MVGGDKREGMGGMWYLLCYLFGIFNGLLVFYISTTI